MEGYLRAHNMIDVCYSLGALKMTICVLVLSSAVSNETFRFPSDTIKDIVSSLK